MSLFTGLTPQQRQEALSYTGDESHGDDDMSFDYQMLKTLDFLVERPLEYEYRRPIQAIERALKCGLAVASEPHKSYIQGRWRDIKTITLSNQNKELA